MADSSSDKLEWDDSVRLEHYRQLREGIRTHLTRMSRHMLGGLSAMGVILGFTFIDRGDPRAFILLPFLMSFLFSLQIITNIWVARLAAKICQIQNSIDVEEFDFEKQHGVISRGSQPVSYRMATWFIYAMILLTYIITSIVAVYIMYDYTQSGLFSFWSSLILGEVYIILFVISITLLYKYIDYINELCNDVFNAQ